MRDVANFREKLKILVSILLTTFMSLIMEIIALKNLMLMVNLLHRGEPKEKVQANSIDHGE